MSLNGDAYGRSILNFLSGRNPIIFKVPHHGSAQNSYPYLNTVPVKLNRLLALKVLVNVGGFKDSIIPDEYTPDKFQVSSQYTRRSRYPFPSYEMPFETFFKSVSETFTYYICKFVGTKSFFLADEVKEFLSEKKTKKT